MSASKPSTLEALLGLGGIALMLVLVGWAFDWFGRLFLLGACMFVFALMLGSDRKKHDCEKQP